jgi:predicted transcriptional regulator
MNRLIRRINGNHIVFNHYGYYQINDWLELNNIQHDQVDVVVDPNTFNPIIRGIILHDEKDLMMFLLRWS